VKTEPENGMAARPRTGLGGNRELLKRKVKRNLGTRGKKTVRERGSTGKNKNRTPGLGIRQKPKSPRPAEARNKKPEPALGRVNGGHLSLLANQRQKCSKT